MGSRMGIWPQYLWSDANTTKKIIICGYISLVTTLWTDIFIAYIALNPVSTFLRQFYQGDFGNFAGSTIIFFFIAALIIRWFGQIVALPRWTWLLLLLRKFFINRDPDGIFFPLPPSTPTLSALFCCNKFMNVSFIETFALSW